MTKIIVPEDVSSASVDGVKYAVEQDEKHGSVLNVNNGAHVAILTRPPFGYTPASDDAPAEEPEPKKGEDTLLGSSVLPAMIDVGGEAEVQLGVVVARAHAESGLTVTQWNEMPEAEREERLAAVVEAMRQENVPAEDQKEESEEVRTLRALDFGNTEDFPNKSTLVEWIQKNEGPDANDGMSRPILEGIAADHRDEMVEKMTKDGEGDA